MSESARLGLPLLSGPPPLEIDSTRAEAACRKCNKEFSAIFTRRCRCNHCGYSYCSSCTDYQALMPRTNNDGGNPHQTGYESMPVCSFCIDNLHITAAGRGQLKAQPLSRLRKYVEAYNIQVNGAIEKDDYIDHIIRARGPNGCLSRTNEEFYRKYSVPNRASNSRPRGLFSRLDPTSQPYSPPRQPPPRPQTQRPAFARPDLEPDPPIPPSQQQYQPPPGPPPPQSTPFPRPDLAPQNQYSPPSGPPPGQQYRPSPTPSYHQPPNQPRPNPPHPQQAFPSSTGRHSPPRPASAYNANVSPHQSPPPASRTRATSASPSVPPAPPPTLDQLLTMREEGIKSLSVSALKAILFENHVNARLILEKSDLVAKVVTLVEDERIDRERKAREEEEEAIERQRVSTEENQMGSDVQDEEKEPSANTDNDNSGPPPLPPKAQAMAARLERTGLCVICQDEEANIAIVDCGHLAMCRGCSDLIMDSSRECPLCRTRIITEQRLLRIYKT